VEQKVYNDCVDCWSKRRGLELTLEVYQPSQLENDWCLDYMGDGYTHKHFLRLFRPPSYEISKLLRSENFFCCVWEIKHLPNHSRSSPLLGIHSCHPRRPVITTRVKSCHLIIWYQPHNIPLKTADTQGVYIFIFKSIYLLNVYYRRGHFHYGDRK